MLLICDYEHFKRKKSIRKNFVWKFSFIFHAKIVLKRRISEAAGFEHPVFENSKYPHFRKNDPMNLKLHFCR